MPKRRAADDEIIEWAAANPTPGYTHAGADRIKGEFVCGTGRAIKLARRAAELGQSGAESPGEDLRGENRDLRAQLEQALAALEEARGAKEPPESPRRSADLRTDHARVFAGDLHGYYQDTAAAEAFIADLAELQPALIVLLGDVLECGGFLAQHQTMGFVAEAAYTFEQDAKAANGFLSRLQEACPNARIDYLEGNHEHRIERWCMTQTLRHAKDARVLYEYFNPAKVLSLEERGIRYVRQKDFADDVSIRGTARYGSQDAGVFATHGITACKHAAAKHVERFGGNVVYGHTHRVDSYVINTVSTELIGGWCPGCLCQRVQLWNHRQPDNWVTGYHLQLVAKSGLFQPMNVKLIGGRSLLHPLLRADKGNDE